MNTQNPNRITIYLPADRRLKWERLLALMNEGRDKPIKFGAMIEELVNSELEKREKKSK